MLPLTSDLEKPLPEVPANLVLLVRILVLILGVEQLLKVYKPVVIGPVGHHGRSGMQTKK